MRKMSHRREAVPEVSRLPRFRIDRTRDIAGHFSTDNLWRDYAAAASPGGGWRSDISQPVIATAMRAAVRKGPVWFKKG